MTRIDRYLLFLYVRVLAICFCSVTGLLIVVHVFSNLEEFLRFKDVTNTSLIAVLVDYYWPYTLSIFDRLSGLLALLALLFVIAWLNKTNEFTALLAAGVTKRRVIRPLLIASAIVILSASAVREFAIPNHQDNLARNPQDLTNIPRPIRPTYDPQASVLLQGKHLLSANKEIVGPILKIQGGPLSKPFGSKILAASAFYQPATPELGSGYLFKQVSTPQGIDTAESVFMLDGKPLLLTSKDQPWIAPGDCFLASEIAFDTLRGGTKQFASTVELIANVQDESARSGNDLRVQIHQRILRPAVDWTVILLGIPVLLTRPDRHMFWVAGNCLFIVAGFSAIMLGLAALGTSGYLVSPSQAAWLPLLVFTPWGWAKTAAALES